MNLLRKIIGIIRSYFVYRRFDKSYTLNHFRIGRNYKINSISRISIGKKVHIGDNAVINCPGSNQQKSLHLGNNIYIGRMV